MAELQSSSNLSDGYLGVYCTGYLSQDLARRREPLEYLKQWDFEAECWSHRRWKPEEADRERKSVWTAASLESDTGRRCHWAQRLGSLSKVENQQAFWGAVELWQGQHLRWKGKRKALPPTCHPAAQATITMKTLGSPSGTQGRARWASLLWGQTGPAWNPLTFCMFFKREGIETSPLSTADTETSPASREHGWQGSWAEEPWAPFYGSCSWNQDCQRSTTSDMQMIPF